MYIEPVDKSPRQNGIH